MIYTILADAVVALHLGYVAFVLVALLLTLIGISLRWQWVRNLRFRLVHLIMVEVVALEGAFGILCPLTTWETKLRERARRAAEVSEAVAALPPSPTPPTGATTEPARKIQEPALVPQSEKAAPSNIEPPAQPTPPTPPATSVAPPPVMPTAPAPQQPQQPEERDSTFVGELLDSILYLNVPQRELDRWYERFGFLTLVVFLAFPPRLGSWSPGGLTGVALLWVGTLFIAAAYYDWAVARGGGSEEGAPSWYSDASLVTGLVLLAVGGTCLWRGCGCSPPAEPLQRVESQNLREQFIER